MKQIYRKKLNLALVILGFVMLLIIWSGQAMAQNGGIKVSDQALDTSFREHVTFTLSAASKAEIVDIDLLYKIAGQIATSRNAADFVPGTTVEAEFVIDQTEPGNYFPPGTELQYWWEITDAGGNTLTTKKESFLYLDDRYDWTSLQNDRLTLSWYKGSDAFGQNLFDRANDSLDTLETDLGVTLEEPIKIFIYANHDDFLNAYFAAAQEWAGGAAFNESGVVMMTVEPQQPEWGTIITTHEMTHLVIHRATDNFYTGDLTLPRWLDEGIAVYTSGEIYTRPDFQQALNQAVKNNKLLTLRTLSSPFSSDTDEAVLSYAQSGAVVKFIIDTYGAETMSALLKALSEGALYDEALEQTLGLDTDGLDNAFRESIDLPPLPTHAVVEEPEPAREMVPTQTAEEVGEETVEQSEQLDNTGENIGESVGSNTDEGATSEGISAPPAEGEQSAPNPWGAMCCLSGLIPLVLLGLAFYASRFM
ncbi:MAG: hypothetical protein JW953_21510 [Anaerolineae bacterium]|nr:hypothetical protein [Anaerolineae bacterium]